MDDQTPLPPNWECRLDSRTGRYYFVNLFTKSTTWDDPRARFRTTQLSSESIPLQQMHASPYHVYPSNNYPAQNAFQNPPSGVPNVQSNTSSPQFNLKRQQLEMSPIIRSTPHTPRSQVRSVAPRKSIQETSFSSQLQENDTDVVVSKINTMFPTVPENHIRMLLKKYVKGLFPKAEETVILDILANVDNNVQKASEKLIQMGYSKKDVIAANKAALKKKEVEQQEREEKLLLTPKPLRIKTLEEKRKMRQRLQSQFSQIPEKVVLMALESVDYSEERAIQILNIVTQEDNPEPKTVGGEQIKQESDVDNNNEQISYSSSSKVTSGMRKTESCATTALLSGESHTSLNYHQIESRSLEEVDEVSPYSSNYTSPDDKNLLSKSRLPKTQLYHFKTQDVVDNKKEDVKSKSDVKEEKLVHLSNLAKGPDPNLRRGPNDELLLSDYMTWNGANPDMTKGRKTQVRGPDKSLLGERTYVPRGSNKELWKGSSTLAKGSMYSRADVVCN